MLEKFRPGETPESAVLATAMENKWNELNDYYLFNEESVLVAIRRALKKTYDALVEGKPRINMAVEGEAELQKEHPKLLELGAELQKLFDDAKGWKISWQQIIPPEVLDMEIDDSHPNITFNTIKRAPPMLEEDFGWVLGAEVGVSRVFGNFSAWVAVGYAEDADGRMMTNLAEMYQITLTPPTN